KNVTDMTSEERQMQKQSSKTVIQQLINVVAPLQKHPPLPTQPAMGFFTDTSLCIGCKACEVACKQWNQLPATDPVWSGSSYDNTRQLGATTWRHVQFIEEVGRRQDQGHDASEAIVKAKQNGTIPASAPGA